MSMRGSILALAVGTLVLAPPAELHAQDFLFGSPRGQLTLRAGPVLHNAGGDLFDFFRSELTLDRGSFRAPMIGGEFSFVVHPRVDLAVGVAWAQAERRSESRDFVEEVNGEELPIEQVTRLRTIPITGTVRFYPMSRGDAVSGLVWLPERFTPYIGAGAGMTAHRLEQEGDFVASEDLSIFTARFRSTGTSPTAHALAGADWWFTPRIGLNAEARYTIGSARPQQDFSTYDRIDLSGAQLGIGLTLRW